MSQHSYQVTVRSAAPPEVIFELLADATSWPAWAGPVVTHCSWEREGDSPPGGVGAVRRAGRPPILAREEIVVSEPPHHLAYTIVRGQPVRDYRADVFLLRARTGTIIEWSGRFTPRVPGTGVVLAAFYGRLIAFFARRLARYAEARSASAG